MNILDVVAWFLFLTLILNPFGVITKLIKKLDVMFPNFKLWKQKGE